MTTALSTSAAARTQIARQFLESLLGPLPPDLAAVEIRRKRIGEQGTRQEFYASVDVDLSNFDPAENVWYGVCLRKKDTRTGKAADVALAPVIWLDYDSVEDKDAVVRRLLEFEVQPTHIVDSGGGVHAYYRLDRPVDLRDESQATLVREVVHGLAHELGADTKVHDLARVMRLPGTLNPGNGTTKTYNPPREVRVLHADTERRVALDELAEFRQPIVSRSVTPVSLPVATAPVKIDQLRVSERWKKLIRSGWAKGCGYPSRSELDHAVMVALIRAKHTSEEIIAIFQDPGNKIGEKYREKGADGPRYLSTTLTNAQQWVASAEAQGRALRLEDGGMKAYRSSRNAWETVYTKPIVPLARLRGATDAWQVQVASEPPITLDSNALSSANALKRALPPVGAWTGSDQDVQRLVPYFEAHGAVPEKTSVGTIGLHGDRVVFPDAILGSAGLETDSPLVYTGHYRAASLHLDENWEALARTIGGLLLSLHEPGAIHAIAGWFLATFVAPRIRELASRGFPLLNVHGTTGSGKTTLLSLLWRMTGSTRDPISIQGSTDFSRTMNLSGTNTLPIVFDEHRATGHGLSRFYATLRESYQAEDHERGRADLTVVRLPLTSPIAVAGESALPDPALRQRALIVRLSHEMLGAVSPPSERRQAKAAFESLPLHEFNGGFYQRVRTADLKLLWIEESARAARLMPLHTDDRKRQGPIAALVGLRLFADFLPGYDADEAAKAIAGLGADEDEPSLVRLIVIALFTMMQRRELRIDQDVKLDQDSLCLSPALVLNKLSTHLRREGSDLPCSEDALRDALRAENRKMNGQGIVLDMRAGKWLGGKSSKVIELSLHAIEETYGIHKQQWTEAAAPSMASF